VPLRRKPPFDLTEVLSVSRTIVSTQVTERKSISVAVHDHAPDLHPIAGGYRAGFCRISRRVLRLGRGLSEG